MRPQGIPGDFANGVLFGKLICELGFIDEEELLPNLTDKQASSAKVRNFEKLLPVLQAAGVDGVSRELLLDVASEQRGSALKLLNSIRLAG